MLVVLVTPIQISCQSELAGKPGAKPDVRSLNVFLYAKVFRKEKQTGDNEFLVFFVF